MIITVTLNAAIDKSLSVPSFRLGRRHRTVERRALAGGKGVNIARMLKTLGQPVIATGFQGGPTGTQIVAQLSEESRTNTSVLDPTTGEQTEINEQGPRVEPDEVDELREKLLYLARGAAVVVFAGSLPRGIDPDFYAQLVRAVHKLDVLTVVDTDGEALRLATRAEPDVVSPNVIEAEELVGHEFGDDADYAGAVREIVSLGARSAIMTTRDGCWAQMLVDGVPRAYRVTIPQQETVAAVGSGDAFLAGYIAERYRGSSPAECLRFGVACGAEATGRLGAGLLDVRAVERLLVDVAASEVEAPAGVG